VGLVWLQYVWSHLRREQQQVGLIFDSKQRLLTPNQQPPHAHLTTTQPVDYLKCAHPLAWTLSNLVFSALEFPDGYKSSGNWDAMLNNVKAMADWLIKAHVKASDDPDENEFVGQVCAEKGGGNVCSAVIVSCCWWL